MALNKAQLMEVPGGPGVIGAVKAGTNITISPDGTINAAGGSATTFAGLGLATDASNALKVAIPESSTTPPIGAATNQGVVGSLYWDNNIGALFIYYNDGAKSQWVQTTASAGSGGSLPSGTTLLFAQAAAPTGWTQIVAAAFNDSALRLVTSAGAGTGGTIAFSTLFSATSTYTGGITITSGQVGDTTLTTNQLASHVHFIGGSGNAGGGFNSVAGSASGRDAGVNSDPAGGDQSHTHTLAGAQAIGNFTSDFGVKYVNVIACTKS
jgi:hypothetical protein